MTLPKVDGTMASLVRNAVAFILAILFIVQACVILVTFFRAELVTITENVQVSRRQLIQ